MTTVQLVKKLRKLMYLIDRAGYDRTPVRFRLNDPYIYALSQAAVRLEMAEASRGKTFARRRRVSEEGV